MEDDTRIQQAARVLLGQLRAGDGLDSDAAEELKASLMEAAREWGASSMVPKSTANLFVDLWPAIESCRFLYPEPIASAIEQLALEVADLAREATSG